MITDFSHNIFGYNPGFLSVLTLFICSTFLIVSCVWFRKRCRNLFPDQTFKGLEEAEESYFNDISISTVPRVSFPLQQQVSIEHHTYQNNPELPYNKSVNFESIPNVIKKTQNRVDNLFGQLRPRISRIGSKLPNGKEETKKQLDIIKKISTGSFPRSQLQYIKELGINQFSKVLQGEAYNMQPGKKRTQVTVVMIDSSIHSTHQLALLREALPYRDLKHNNIMRFYCICTDSEPPLTIYESLKMGDLKTFLRCHRSEMHKLIKQGSILSMMCDVTAGLQALHHMDYVHRDLALRNCMLSGEMVVKIGDYGLSEQLYKDDYYYNDNNDDDSVGIPLRWMAPESLTLSYSLHVNDVTKEANIWTMGVVMWEVLRCGDVPYPDLSNDHVIRLVAVEKEVRPQRPLVVMNNIKYIYELMDMCWAYDPSNRPTIRELKILLLHLASSNNTDDVIFNEKWNQLKPIITSTSKQASQKTVNVGGVTNSNKSCQDGDVNEEDANNNNNNINNNNNNNNNTNNNNNNNNNINNNNINTNNNNNINTNNNNINTNNNNNNNDDESSDSDLLNTTFSKRHEEVSNSTNNLSLAEELKLDMKDITDACEGYTTQAGNNHSNTILQGLNTTYHHNDENNEDAININDEITNISNDTFATSYDDYQDDNSLLKMARYNQYLNTVTTSIDEPTYNSQMN